MFKSISKNMIFLYIKNITKFYKIYFFKLSKNIFLNIKNISKY